MQKITPFLWYDTQAEEAARFYTSIFPNSSIKDISHYAEGGPMPAGTVMVVNFEIDGQEFSAMNAGPQFPFTEAVSFTVNCETQEEVDRYWNALLEGGGSEVACGWLKDRFGLSWQITPTIMGTFMSDPDPEKVKRVMDAMMQMVKLDIDTLQKAYDS
jgi:predicted 3-demethylubiquinone-9 3-methyltransferase (glyoxalase superfamily)